MKLHNSLKVGAILLAIALVFFFVVLGTSGMLSALGLVLLFVVPFYLILGHYNLEGAERIVFSFFISVGIFPAIAYWLGMAISFRVAIFVTFIILVGIGLFLGKVKKKKHVSSE